MLNSIIVAITLVLSSVQSDVSTSSQLVQKQDFLYQEGITGKYIEDLKTFVRSISKQKYQPESYWEEVDVLWESIQERKENLQSQFTGEELKQIRKWEKKYHQIRKKQTKLS